MKLFRTVTMIASLGVALSAGNVTLTTDALTGLPIDPKSDLGMHLGNAPTKMTDSQICNSKMQANLYTVYDTVDATVAWYAAHLTGFHKTHAYFDNRSQNRFYNDAGTLVVSVLGEGGQDGQNVDTHSVTYYRFQPGLPAKAIVSFGQHKIECQ
jgi:hypothetical protein